MKTIDESGSTLQPALQLHAKALKQQLEQVDVPEFIERDLMAAFDKQYPPNAWWQRVSVFQWRVAGALTASVFAVLVLLKSPQLAPIDSPVVAQQENVDEIPFVAFGSGETILQQDSMRVVQTEVPYSVLASMGVPVNPQVAGGYSKAEVLLGENDELLAVRFLPI